MPPEGAKKLRPRRPLPAVCASASIVVPCGAVFTIFAASRLVDSVTSRTMMSPEKSAGRRDFIASADNMSAGACNTADDPACTCYAAVIYAVDNAGCLILSVAHDTAYSIGTLNCNVACKILKNTMYISH